MWFPNPNSTPTRWRAWQKTSLVTSIANVVEVEAHGPRCRQLFGRVTDRPRRNQRLPSASTPVPRGGRALARRRASLRCCAPAGGRGIPGSVRPSRAGPRGGAAAASRVGRWREPGGGALECCASGDGRAPVPTCPCRWPVGSSPRRISGVTRRTIRPRGIFCCAVSAQMPICHAGFVQVNAALARN